MSVLKITFISTASFSWNINYFGNIIASSLFTNVT